MEIECIFFYRQDYNTSNEVYTCKAVKASIIKPNVDIISFKGNHWRGRSNIDVTWMSFCDLEVEYFPRNLQRIFPNLNALAIDRCGLKEISREDLIGLKNLFYLDLSGNELKSLPDDLFENMPNLKRVFFDNNKIEFVRSKLIEPIVKNDLDWFDLEDNTSINEYYTRDEYPGACGTIQELMAKIDEKCKSPKSQMASNALHNHSSCCASDEILKCCNEFRRLGLYTDFIITVGSKELPVNKIILASQSSVFAEMLKVKTNGRFASKLEISEMSQQAVEAFLDFLYERKQPDEENAAEVFKLSSKYDVAKLKAICEQIIRESLDESNAIEIFKLGCGPYKSEELKIAAFKKLQQTIGVELGDHLMNNPENLQKIVAAKKLLDDLVEISKIT